MSDASSVRRRMREPGGTSAPSRAAVLIGTAVALGAGAWMPADAQTIAAANGTPLPVRPLGPIVATGVAPLASVTSVRATTSGLVLVNDQAARRLLLLDSTLTTVRVVLEGAAYGGEFGGLIPYRGDSTLFVDPLSMAMVLLDPAGRPRRTLAVPQAGEAMQLVGRAIGNPGFDAQGRLVYRGRARRELPEPNADGEFATTLRPDSAPLVRTRAGTRAVDTVTFVRTETRAMRMQRDARGRLSLTITVNPLSSTDDWAVLTDGTLLVLRGADYRAELFGPDGARRPGPRVPFAWQRLDDDQKAPFLDSVRAVIARQGNTTPIGLSDREQYAASVGAPPQARPVAAASGGTSAPAPIALVAAQDLPDYRPAFFAGGIRADADGRAWVRTTAALPARGSAAGAVYDVLDARGRLVDRVQVPAGAVVVGFAPGGFVYLATREASGVRLHRARVR